MGLSIDLDVTYLIVLALFLAPLVILNSLLFGPFLKLFEERHHQLEGAISRAEAMLSESEERARAFEAKIQVASVKGIEVRNRLRLDAAEELRARIEREREKIASKLETTLKDLSKERAEALQDAQVEATRLAELTAVKLLGRGF